jgi:hypothetical protein
MEPFEKLGIPTNGDSGRRPYRVAVANASFEFQDLVMDDPKPIGRQLLEKSGFRPAEKYLIFQVLEDGALDEKRLDEIIELRAEEKERFIAFQSDRSFRVEIDRRRFEWGAAELTGLVGKQMAGKDPACNGLWLERQDEPDRFLQDADVVKLNTEGVERLHTGPAFVLCIEGKEHVWFEATITTEQIAQLGGWEPSQGVQQIDIATNEAHTLKPEEVVDLKDHRHFAKKIGWRRG